MRFNPRAEVAAVWLSNHPCGFKMLKLQPLMSESDRQIRGFYPEMIVDSYILVLLPGLMTFIHEFEIHIKQPVGLTEGLGPCLIEG
jgi:hypothetical protein